MFFVRSSSLILLYVFSLLITIVIAALSSSSSSSYPSSFREPLSSPSSSTTTSSSSSSAPPPQIITQLNMEKYMKVTEPHQFTDLLVFYNNGTNEITTQLQNRANCMARGSEYSMTVNKDTYLFTQIRSAYWLIYHLHAAPPSYASYPSSLSSPELLSTALNNFFNNLQEFRRELNAKLSIPNPSSSTTSSSTTTSSSDWLFLDGMSFTKMSLLTLFPHNFSSFHRLENNDKLYYNKLTTIYPVACLNAIFVFVSQFLQEIKIPCRPVNLMNFNVH